jgi:hypothetical protein
MFLTLCRWPAIVRALRSSAVRARHARRARHRPGLRWSPLEQLEGRVVPAVVTLNVTSLADSGPGTLRGAIMQADGGAASNSYVINIEKAGTITLESALPDLSRDITIKGLGPSHSTVQRDASAARFGIFTVDAGETVSLSGLTIAGGDSSGNGGGVDNFGTVTVSNSTFTGNSASEGGGQNNESGGTATVSNSTFTSNSAGFGGGLENFGTARVSGSLFIGNSATASNDSGGGGLLNAGDGTVTVEGSTFTGNSAAYGGGLENVAMATVSGSLFTGNSAAVVGGGLANGSSGTLQVSDSAITDNSAALDGGGIANIGTLTLSGNLIVDNSPDDSDNQLPPS